MGAIATSPWARSEAEAVALARANRRATIEKPEGKQTSAWAGRPKQFSSAAGASIGLEADRNANVWRALRPARCAIPPAVPCPSSDSSLELVVWIYSVPKWEYHPRPSVGEASAGAVPGLRRAVARARCTPQAGHCTDGSSHAPPVEWALFSCAAALFDRKCVRLARGTADMPTVIAYKVVHRLLIERFAHLESSGPLSLTAGESDVIAATTERV